MSLTPVAAPPKPKEGDLASAGSLVPVSSALRGSFPAVGAAVFKEVSLPTSTVGDPMVSVLAGAVTVEALPAEREVGSAAAVESLRPPLATVTAADANESSTEARLAPGLFQLAGLVPAGNSDGAIIVLPSSTTVAEEALTLVPVVGGMRFTALSANHALAEPIWVEPPEA